MDDNGRDDEPVRLACTVTVAGSDVTVDVSDSAAQQVGAINCPWGYTLSACRFALKRLTSPDLAASSGTYRALEVIAPKGSVFNPGSPAPVFCGIWTALRLGDMIINALAPALPDRVPAPQGGDLVVILAYIEDPDTRQISFFLDLGGIGTGAIRDRDGTSGLMHPCQAGSESIPAEILETRMPVLKRRLELVPDSGGPGRYRGGLSTIAEFEFLGDGATTIVCEKAKVSGGRGVDGGLAPPFKNAIILFPGTDRELRLGKKADIPLRRGDSVLVRAAGGGGCGDPLERAPEMVAADVRDGYVSPEQAYAIYGVALERSTGDVDHRSTSELRRRLREERERELAIGG
jgi:N-methylhydantoinase B